MINGAAAGDMLGAVGAAGDVNGDLVDDLVLGALTDRGVCSAWPQLRLAATS